MSWTDLLEGVVNIVARFVVVTMCVSISLIMIMNIIAVMESSYMDTELECDHYLKGTIPVCSPKLSNCGLTTETNIETNVEKHCFQNGKQVNCSKIEGGR